MDVSEQKGRVLNGQLHPAASWGLSTATDAHPGPAPPGGGGGGSHTRLRSRAPGLLLVQGRCQQTGLLTSSNLQKLTRGQTGNSGKALLGPLLQPEGGVGGKNKQQEEDEGAPYTG